MSDEHVATISGVEVYLCGWCVYWTNPNGRIGTMNACGWGGREGRKYVERQISLNA